MSKDAMPIILMLEHDQDDRFLSQSFLGQYPVQLEFVNYSDELFAYLDGTQRNEAPLPVLILINLHATPQDGREILQELKAHPLYKSIPVIILSGISSETIVKECYALGASSFIRKPILIDDTDGKISTFFRYWFETVELF